MISKVPIWSSTIKPIRLKQQQNRMLHMLHKSESSNVSSQGKLINKTLRTWKIIYVSNQYIVLSDLKDKKITYIYDQQSYKIYESNQIYQFCVEVNHKLYLFFAGKSMRYEVDLFDSGLISKIEVEGQKPLFKNDCICSFNSLKNQIFIFGRKTSHQFQITSPLWAYDIVNCNWQQFEDQNIENFLSNVPLNSSYIMSKSYIYIFDIKKITVWGINESKAMRVYETKINLPIKTIIYNIVQNDTIIVCLNNQSLIIVDDIKSLKYIDIGIFLQDMCYSFSGIVTNEKDLKLYGQVQVEPAQQPSFVSVKIWNIQLNELSPLKDSENIPLLYYFNKKNYSDLIFVVEGRQIYCSRLLFEHYSPKFKKIYVNSNSKTKPVQTQTTVKVDTIKYPTLYFLIEQLYNNFNFKSNFDEETFLQLMQTSSKFQIRQMQAICQKNIPIQNSNFAEVCDFYLFNQTHYLKDRLLKQLVTNYIQISKKMHIGKIEELIRGFYIPQCSHTNLIQLKSIISNYYIIKKNQNQQRFQRNENLKGLVEGGQVLIQVCQKCFRLMGFEGIKKNRGLKYQRQNLKNQ